ncbi:MAG: MFS transporter [Hyphomicrobiales bacterium]|nr:MFS transporter [Hyphomicrobiales bacterium]
MSVDTPVAADTAQGIDLQTAPARATPSDATSASAKPANDGTVHVILWTMCFAHFLNDTLQALIPAVLPILKVAYNLDFGQVGVLAAAFMISASIFQPIVGVVTDKKTFPYALAIGMCATMAGLLLFAGAGTYAMLLVAAVMVGFGSAIFHPEGSRVARMAAGGRHGLAQSTFQVGGNFGQASGPLMAAFVIVPLGQAGIGWFGIVAFATVVLLYFVGRWVAAQLRDVQARKRHAVTDLNPLGLSKGKLTAIIGLLLLLTFSKSFYTASISTFYTFYLMQKFALGLRDAQLMLFLFMGSVAAGVYFGGPIGDRIGRKYVIWISILGALPFTLALPYANLFWCGVLTVFIGFILSASMSQIIVYALELLPGRVGLISGLFFGFAFGMAGLGAAVLGYVADLTSLDFVFKACAFLPAIGLCAWFLPKTEKK